MGDCSNVQKVYCLPAPSRTNPHVHTSTQPRLIARNHQPLGQVLLPYKRDMSQSVDEIVKVARLPIPGDQRFVSVVTGISRPLHPAAAAALAAAALFGASTPFAKAIVGQTSPILLAGLLYLGSGIGLAAARLIRDRGWQSADLSRREWPWLLGAIGFGGILGPIFLMLGLARTAATNASLLLNLEAVLTAVIAWVVFRENTDRRIIFGMALIVAAGVVLSWPSAQVTFRGSSGALLITLACVCWAIDNNLTRKVSASDPMFIAGLKGWVAGIVNVGLAFALGVTLPSGSTVAEALLVGFLGYGTSLVLFVLALRGLGSARTGAYFSTAPFIGAAVAILAFGEPTSMPFWIAASLMAAGLWLHLTERHEHVHTHEAMAHTHRHMHDEHHQHTHAFPWDGTEPHAHPHVHERLTHSHPHYPDVHHRHRHDH
jgi:drug/metabolite transporter (DMT)-like permease